MGLPLRNYPERVKGREQAEAFISLHLLAAASRLSYAEDVAEVWHEYILEHIAEAADAITRAMSRIKPELLDDLSEIFRRPMPFGRK